MERINIACVKWGKLYSADYVNILFDMIRRNLPERFKLQLFCFTDDPTGINQEVHIRSLPGNLSGWWNKLYLFKEGHFPEGEQVFYFDLDTVITGSLDEIFTYQGEFAILRDFYRPGGLQSSVMSWKADHQASLWHDYELENFPDIEGGDQIWIEQKYKLTPDIWQELYPKRFVSYKVHAAKIFPDSASVVVFHGEPSPHEVTTGWVPHIWKIGGGSALELEMVSNTKEDEIIKNIRYALSLDLPVLDGSPVHDKHAVIIGGGPSLQGSLKEIKARKNDGQIIFSTNNTYNYLLKNEIVPDFHVMLDAREENKEFIPFNTKCLYSSQCHPEVFKEASKSNNSIMVWHPMIHGIHPILESDKRSMALVGGGSSVGLKSIAIAYIMGFRNIHVYGMDSSYAESHHAYPQSLNDNERTLQISCNGLKYKAAAWMATQVEEFKRLACELVQLGCVLTIHGTGLLPDMAKLMVIKKSPAQVRAYEILSRLNKENAVGAEIGVFTGELSVNLLQKPDLNLYMVDPWSTFDPDSDYAKSGDFHAELSQEQQEIYFQHTAKAVEAYKDRARIIRKPSIEAAKDISNSSLDFVFIDADHSYEGCKSDIAAWFPKLKPGSLLSGHDYKNTDYPCFGVEKAVDEFCADHNLPVELGDNFTWFVRVPDNFTLNNA